MRRRLCLPLSLCLAACATTPSTDPAPAPPPAPAVVRTPPAKQPEPPLAWWHGAVFYEVFVRSFQDSNGDGVGDLRGLTSRLDYLNDGDPTTETDLGVTALWLMPIFESPSYHGYDVVDYLKVDPEYGTEEDLKALLDACHQRGIRVIVDFMLNHTSVEHPWFVEASAGTDATHRGWYLFRPDDPGWTQPWGNGKTWHPVGDAYYYGLFWSGMPDLDFQQAAVQAEFEAIGHKWLELGLDGFRLDAIRHLVEDGSSAPDVTATHGIVQRLTQSWKAAHPDAMLVGEIWAGPEIVGQYWDGGQELDLAFDFGLAGGIVGAVSQRSARPLHEALLNDHTWLPVQRFSAPFITNHDQDRVASILGGDVERLKMAATTLLTVPGTPFVYYGEEIGLKNTPVGGDPAKRAPMQWTAEGPGHGFTTGTPWESPLGVGQKYSVAAHEADPGALLHHYRHLIHLRQESPALREGLLVGQELSASGETLTLQRAAPGEIAVVTLHFGAAQLELGAVTLSTDALAASGLAGIPLVGELLVGEGGVEIGSNAGIVVAGGAVGPMSARVVRIRAADGARE